MSTTRLTFLYPHLFRIARLGEESTVNATQTRCRKSTNLLGSSRGPHISPTPVRATAAFSTSARSKHAPFERHGSAVEPVPVAPDVVKLPHPDKDGSDASQPSPTSKSPSDKAPEKPEKPEKQGKQAKKSLPAKETEVEKEKETAETKQEPDKTTADPIAGATTTVHSAAQTPQQAETEARMQQSGPMDAVLHMPPPQSSTHPHISTPPYVHHFDSYGLVKQLETGGYSNEQSITVMKAVRGLLAQHLDVAQSGLVSKSDVDNETYLFRAACSELSSEVKNNRKQDDEQTRQQRTHLQHEVDILGQRMSQDVSTLKDDVKGMFNDRRMNVREEQRTMDSRIQQINLKIGVTLNSDSRSEIEGLRWVLIRRSVLGILFMALLTLGSIRYTTYLTQVTKKEAEEQARQADALKRDGGREDHAPAVDAAEILAAN